MIKYNNSNKNYTLDEMLDALHNPQGKRSLAELDTVIDEIIQRNPDFVEEINKIVNASNERTS